MNNVQFATFLTGALRSIDETVKAGGEGVPPQIHRLVFGCMVDSGLSFSADQVKTLAMFVSRFDEG